MSQSPLDYLLDPLTDSERDEFMQFQHYVESFKAGQHIPEGSAGAVINRLSPAVRAVVQTLSDTFETPRTKPFDAKMTEDDYADTFGFDPDIAKGLKAQLDGEHVMNGLQERLGTDADREPEPLTMRDQIEAALENTHGI